MPPSGLVRWSTELNRVLDSGFERGPRPGLFVRSVPGLQQFLVVERYSPYGQQSWQVYGEVLFEQESLEGPRPVIPCSLRTCAPEDGYLAQDVERAAADVRDQLLPWFAAGGDASSYLHLLASGVYEAPEDCLFFFSERLRAINAYIGARLAGGQEDVLAWARPLVADDVPMLEQYLSGFVPPAS